MDVVVEDDDPHHHPHAEEQRVLAAESGRVLPGEKSAEEEELASAQLRLVRPACRPPVRRVMMQHSRRLEHDLADAGHGAETVGRVLQREGLILHRATP